MLGWVKMARSTFYYHLAHANDTDGNDELRHRIKKIFEDSKKRYGYRRICWQLRDNRQEVNHKLVLKLMKGMGNKGYKFPNELSGGEQQRIVIARAMLNSPEIILADEPTGNLDAETGRAIVGLLHNISRTGGSLVLMTTHNLHLLHEFPGQVYRCAGHQITDVTSEYSEIGRAHV